MKTQKGFGLVPILLILLLVTAVGFTGYYVYNQQSKNKTDKSEVSRDTSNKVAASPTLAPTNSVSSTPTPTPTVDLNEGYVVVKEWGLRFKTPASIKDVSYQIIKDNGYGEVLAFYAKPKDADTQYVTNYLDVDNGNPTYSVGTVYRSLKSSQNKVGNSVNGKRIGNYYYYSAWSFSSLATGAGCVRLYQIKDDDLQCKLQNQVFKDVNMGDNALINTIGLIN